MDSLCHWGSCWSRGRPFRKSDSPSVIDYHASIPTESLIYTITSTTWRGKGCSRSILGLTALVSRLTCTPLGGRVQEEVVERDGKNCALTGDDEALCDAVHLLAHSKGDTYISTYTHRRSRDPAGTDIVEDIDDVRNGLVLTNAIHRLLGKDIAFLMTPNFALTTTDIDPNALSTEKRCTSHFFRHLVAPTIQSFSNSRIHSSYAPNYPPAILFDAVYASAVMHHFGTQSLKDGITETWKDTFDPGGVTSVEEAEYKAILDKERNLWRKHRSKPRTYWLRPTPDTFDMLMTLPYVLVPRDQMQAVFREAEERTKAMEKRNAQEKVGAWLRHVLLHNILAPSSITKRQAFPPPLRVGG
ncbi:hypothetical protein CPB84DRAFT_1902336 [Gymnopilus junonius]|uniref:HNH nuclease domain-containing protein n=1 Tax=Gymnopilus junonius TaxID=109634 RepID=A0A9P5TTD2_GYMJU|nr:hypothetical protein CPB84DRAFT_1902336 [Gymnopilus junonius]